MINASGEVIIPAMYDEIGWSSGDPTPIDGVIAFRQQGLWGLISVQNKVVSEAKYVHINKLEKKYLLAGLKSRYSNKVNYGLLTTDGSATVGFQYSSISPIGEYLIVSQMDNRQNRYGIIDYKERTTLQFKYDYIQSVNDKVLVVTHDQKSALYQTTGRPITPFFIDEYKASQNDYHPFSSLGQWGVFDGEGNITLPPVYRSVSLNDPAIVEVEEYSQWKAFNHEKEVQFEVATDTILGISKNLLLSNQRGNARLFSSKGHFIDSLLYEQVVPLDSTMLLIQQDGKYGVRKIGGGYVLDPIHDYIEYQNPFFYTLTDKGWHIYNKFGRKLTSRPLLEVVPGGETLVAAKRDRYWGYVDYTGKLAISYKYDLAQPFQGEYAIVKYLNGYGVINTFGQWILQPDHEEILTISDGLFLVRNDEFRQLINAKKEVVFETYNEIIEHPMGLVEKNAEGKFGFIDPKGSPRLNLDYDSISNVLNNEYVILIRNGYYSLVNLEGRIIIPDYSQFEKILPFTEELVGMQKDGKYGYFNLDEQLRIANQYEMAGVWQDGRGPVMLKGKWGFVDLQERLVIQPYYDEVSPFVDGVSIARKGDLYGLLDKDGNEVVQFENDMITRLPSGSYLIRKGDKYGLAQTNGRHSLSTIYDFLEELSSGLYHVKRRGKSGVKDDKNVDVIPLSYDNISYDPINKLIFAKTLGARRTVPLR